LTLIQMAIMVGVVMERCAVCKVEETAICDSGVPICLKCLDARTKGRPPATEPQIRNALLHDILQATALNNEATKEFDSVIGQFPSGLAPDGAQRIRNASANLSIARKEMMRAHTRLNDFIERGIVPEDLKKSG